MAENGKKDVKRRKSPDADSRLATNADKGREPRILSARRGARQYSMAALLERIVAEFFDEHGQDSAALKAADTEAKRLQLVLAVADYVIAVESIAISSHEKADIIRRAYAELFSYGPLDALFQDERITTISLDGADKVSVRYGHGDLTPLAPIFEDERHLRDIVRRLLLHSGADLRSDLSIIETGLLVGERRVGVSVAMPPVTVQLAVDIRVHPVRLPTLAEMVESGFLTEQAATLVTAIAQSPHGVIIVGDTESGKTTLLAVLAALTPPEQQQGMIAIERAGELHLPDAAQRLVVRWPTDTQSGLSLPDQVNAALAQNPACLLLDEVRADEPQAIAPLLTIANLPRQLWAFRGPASSKRLVSALGMLARLSDRSAGEAPVLALYRRLPLVITLQRRQGAIRHHSIAEWQFPAGAEYPNYVELMAIEDGAIKLTGQRPAHELDLPVDFWDTAKR